MTKITDAEFGVFPNQAGILTFSYAQLLAQVITDLQSQGVTSSPNVGLGAIGRASGGQVIGNLLITPVIWDTIDVDDLGFMDVSSGNPRAERFIIPDVDPPIERVKFGGRVNWSPSAGDIKGGDTRYNFNGVGSTQPGGGEAFYQNSSDPAFGNRYTIQNGFQEVSVGDIFTFNVFQDSGAGESYNTAAGWILVVK